MPDSGRQSGRGIEETVVAQHFGPGALPPGTVLGHTYLIEQFLNRGSLGDAYRARHIELGTLYTVTLVQPRIANDARAFEALVEQIRRLEQVHDQAVVAHQGLFRGDNDVRYLVTEYIEGGSLGDFLRQRKLEPGEVLRLRDRLAHGLAAVHERGVVHGDLSPDTILLPDHDIDKATLGGFGTVRLATLGDATVVGKSLPSTYAFASPEQTGLFGGVVDTRSDIYSLGLVLAAAALGFGKRLDMGTTLTAAVAARRRLPDLSSLPEGLRPAIAAMLQPFPENRRLLGGTAPGSGASGERRAAGVRQVLTRRPLLATAIGLVAAMLASATISSIFLHLVSPAPTLNELRARVAAVTRHFKCGAVDQEISTDRTVRLSGHLSSQEDVKKLGAAVAGISGVARVTADLRVVAWPHCEVAAIASPFIRAPDRGAPSLSLKGGALHVGNPLVLDVRAPGFDGYLYIDLYDDDGEVQHLFPTMRDLFNLKPAYNHFVLGCPPLSPVALLGRPGERTISLLATSTPLFSDALLVSERAPAYFANLTAALARLQAGEAAAALIRFSLRAPDGENSGFACAPG